MDIDKLIEALRKEGVLGDVQVKRLTTTELPAQLYVRLIVASLATKKSIGAIMGTALETYTMRNADKHLDEIKLQAAAASMELEEYLADAIARRLKRGGDTE